MSVVFRVALSQPSSGPTTTARNTSESKRAATERAASIAQIRTTTILCALSVIEPTILLHVHSEKLADVGTHGSGDARTSAYHASVKNTGKAALTVADQEPLDIGSVISAQAYACKLRYPNVVEREDLEQEAWIWVLEHPARVEERKATEDSGLGAYRLGQDLWKVMDVYARKEKAARGGYQPEDELFVSDAVINVVLPCVLKGDPTPPVREGERVADTSDPAEGGNWLATFMDVQRAWEAADLTGQQRDLLVSYYRDGLTQKDVADILKISQPTVTKRLKRARAKLIDQLGGREPREYDTQYRDRPGSQHNSDNIIAAMR